MCQAVMLHNAAKGAARMTIIRIGLDTSKHVFQVHGVDENEQPVLQRQIRRSEAAKFSPKRAPTEMGMGGGGGPPPGAGFLRGWGHGVVLTPPKYIKAYA